MLENSLWLRYNPTKTIREVLARLYECGAVEISNDERELYASLKRHLTKKEFRMIMMNEAGLSAEEIGAEVGLDGEALTKAQYKAYRKIRQDKIRLEVRASKAKEEVVSPDDEV
jgi:DNA-binding CsgD family transcriptional regulator